MWRLQSLQLAVLYFGLLGCNSYQEKEYYIYNCRIECYNGYERVYDASCPKQPTMYQTDSGTVEIRFDIKNKIYINVVDVFKDLNKKIDKFQYCLLIFNAK